MPNQPIYDLIIIGAGCAGASGAMYAARMNLKTLMIGEMPGGLITTTHLVENWPGIKSISGPDLGMSLVDHATSLGVPFANERVTEVAKALQTVDQKAANNPGMAQVETKSGYIVKTASNTYYGKTVMFATGTKWKKLGVPGEDLKGVSYCALCDGAFFRGKNVAVVGGGDSAAKEALLLSEFCPKVYLLVRGDKLKAEPINFDRIQKNEKIEVRYKTEVQEIKGEKEVEKILLKSGEELSLQGIFVAIGHIALSEVAQKLGVQLSDKGEIMINRQSETNLSGIYAAGDVCDTKFKQAITGAAEAVTAAYFAFDYIGKNEVVFE